MEIHDIYYDYSALPSDAVMLLLESSLFMWLIVIVTVGMVVWLVTKAWQIHCIPKKQASGSAQAKLVIWLSLLGLFWKPLWLLAVILILIDWQAMATWLRLHLLTPTIAEMPMQQARERSTDNKENQS